MSYRSIVGLCLTNKSKTILDARLAELEQEADQTSIHTFFNLACDKREDQENGAIAWKWEHIEWNGEITGVSFVEQLLQDLENEDYLCIRVGEAEDDTECRGGFWNNPFGMSLVRGIMFD